MCAHIIIAIFVTCTDFYQFRLWVAAILDSLLDLAFALAFEEVLAALVPGQELQLPGVDGAPALAPDHVDRVLVLHAELDEGDGDEHGRPAEAGDAVDPDAGLRIARELGLDQTQPLVHDLRRRRRAVGEGQLRDGDSRVAELVGLVGRVGGADEVSDPVLLEDLDVVVHGGVLGLLRDQEPHVLVLDLGRGRPDDFPRHFRRRR